jgi:hypothetical protein
LWMGQGGREKDGQSKLGSHILRLTSGGDR